MSLRKETTLDEVMELILEKLNAGGSVTFTPNGTSMLPMLRDGQDVVVLSKPKGRLHLFDVALYRRENGQYVLHRVIDFCRDGSYVMCGDNQFAKEKGIRDDQVIAVMTGFCRKGVPYAPIYLRYRAYVNFWYYTRLPRRIFRAVKHRLGFTDEKKDKKDKTEQPENESTPVKE